MRFGLLYLLFLLGSAVHHIVHLRLDQLGWGGVPHALARLGRRDLRQVIEVVLADRLTIHVLNVDVGLWRLSGV